MTARPVGQLAALTVVADGDAYVIGNPRSRCYVAVPPVGAQLINWLRAGDDLETAAARAEQLVGEPVDVADFLDVLFAEGVLDPDPDTDGHRAVPAVPPVRSGWQWAGRILFSPVGWLTQGAIAVAGAVAAVRDHTLLPQPADVIVADNPLASVLVMSVAAVLCTVLHEAGHVLAAAARGVQSRLSVGRRLYFLTAQADLTALWGLPRAQRLPPLLAGLSIDAAVTGGLLLAQAAGVAPAVAHILAATVVLQVAAMVFQAAVFMRTDLYAVLATLSGSRNLWVLKTAVLRQRLRRATTSDQALLAAASRRERIWAGLYLAVHLPGLAFAAWYLLAVTLPGLQHLLTLTTDGLVPFNLGTTRTWESLATVVFVVAPTAGTITAAVTAGVRSTHTPFRGKEASNS